MTFPRERLPIWRHPTRISANRLVRLRPTVGSSASGRSTTHVAGPCLTVPCSVQTALLSSLAQIYTSHGAELPLLNCKIHQLHASIHPGLPLRFATTFYNS